MKHMTKIFMEDCVLVGKKIYFFSRDWNALYVADLKLKRTEFVSAMPEEDILARRLCAGIMYHKKKLILIPMTAKKIWIYDLKTDEWKGLERAYTAGEDYHKEIFRAVEYKNNLFLIGSNYPAIIRMDMDTYKLEYLTEPYTFLEPLKKEIEGYFRSDFCLKENQLLVASCLNNFVLCIDLDTLDFEWREVGNEDFRYSGIAWDGEQYWLSPRTGSPIVKWDGKDKVEFFPLPEGFDNTKYNFLGVQYIDGKLIFPGMLQDKTLVIEPHAQVQPIQVCEGQYTFYRGIGKDGLLSQTAKGLFQWKYAGQREQLSMCCEIQVEKLVEQLMKDDKILNRRVENEIYIESSFSLLSLYRVILKREKVIEKKELSDGVNIWKNIRD